MKNFNKPSVEREKIVSITILFITAAIIILLGASFSVYSFIKNIEINVLNFKVPGAVFGLVMMFLGLRYFFSVQKLKEQVYKSTSRFSWDNFKKQKINNEGKR